MNRYLNICNIRLICIDFKMYICVIVDIDICKLKFKYFGYIDFIEKY